MTRTPILRVAALILLLAVGVSYADWFDDYADGIKAARAEQWGTVISKMTAAIAKKPKEGAKERTYGVNFIPYHPYYYRGMAYYNQGKFDEAMADLRKATGVGEVNLGSAEGKLTQIEIKQAAAQQPVNPPPVQTQTVAPPPVQVTQTTPSVDPGIAPARQAAQDMIGRADLKSREANGARAQTQAPADYAKAQQLLQDARRKASTADSTMDWRDVERSADQAMRTFDLAISTAQMAQAGQQTIATQATNAVIEITRNEVKRAVENYFKGNFTQAASQFQRLADIDKTNPLIWQFLGAAHYYHYVLDGEENKDYLEASRYAFRQAKRLKPSLKLNTKYFSPRLTRMYETAAN